MTWLATFACPWEKAELDELLKYGTASAEDKHHATAAFHIAGPAGHCPPRHRESDIARHVIGCHLTR